MDDVIRARAAGGRLTGELHAENALGAVRRIGRRGGSKNVDRGGVGLAGVVYQHGAVVLGAQVSGDPRIASYERLNEFLRVSGAETHVERVLRKNALAPGCERRNGSGDLVPAAEIALEIERRVRRGVVAFPVPDSGHDVRDRRLGGAVGRCGCRCDSGAREEGGQGRGPHGGSLIIRSLGVEQV